MTLTQWSEKIGIPFNTLRSRLKRGWSVEATLTTPIIETQKHFFNGEEHTLREWSIIKNIDYNILTARLENGWTIEEALTTPVINMHHYVNYDGICGTITDWSDATGLTWDTLRSRLRDGWAPERALTTPKKDGSIHAIYFIDDNGKPISENDVE